MTVPGTQSFFISFFIISLFTRKESREFFNSRLALFEIVLFESHFPLLVSRTYTQHQYGASHLKIMSNVRAAAAEQYLMTHKTRENERERERETMTKIKSKV
jgi:hypothetical protein